MSTWADDRKKATRDFNLAARRYKRAIKSAIFAMTVLNKETEVAYKKE